jgi:hypothetical protein
MIDDGRLDQMPPTDVAQSEEETIDPEIVREAAVVAIQVELRRTLAVAEMDGRRQVVRAERRAREEELNRKRQAVNKLRVAAVAIQSMWRRRYVRKHFQRRPSLHYNTRSMKAAFRATLCTKSAMRQMEARKAAVLIAASQGSLLPLPGTLKGQPGWCEYPSRNASGEIVTLTCTNQQNRSGSSLQAPSTRKQKFVEMFERGKRPLRCSG